MAAPHVPAPTYATRLRSVPFVAAVVLAAVYAVLSVLYVFELRGPAGAVMPPLSAASALGLALFALRQGRRRAAPEQLNGLVLVPLVNSLVHIAVADDVNETTALILAVVAVGAAVTSRRFAYELFLATTVAWVVIVVSLSGSGSGLLLHATVQLLMAVGLAVVVLEMRLRRERVLTVARDDLATQVRALQQAQVEVQASETRFRSVFADSPVGIALADEHGHFVAANPALCRLFGRDEAELIGRSSVDFTHPEDVAGHSHARALLRESLDGTVRVEKRYVRPDGQIRWAWLTITHVDGPAGQEWTLAHVQDVTDRKTAEQALVDSEANLAAVAKVVRRIRTGEDARTSVVEAARQLAGASAAVILEPLDEQTLTITTAAGLDLAGTVVALQATSATGLVWRTGEALLINDPETNPLCDQRLVALAHAQSLMWQPVIAHGQITGILAVTWSHRVAGVSDRAVRAIALLADETAVALEHDSLLARYARLATSDQLTGLPNRRAWDERLPQLMSAADRSGRPLVVAIADLDRFKDYNDRRGHLEGDDLLRRTADGMRETLRTVDFLARWGGEEFVIALPDCTAADADLVLNRVRQAMPDKQTCSIGYALWDGVETADYLITRADKALYAAKHAGRDRTVPAVIPVPRNHNDSLTVLTERPAVTSAQVPGNVDLTAAGGGRDAGGG